MVQYIKRKCKIKPECLWDVRIYKIVKNVEKNVKNYVKNVNLKFAVVRVTSKTIRIDKQLNNKMSRENR